MIQCNLLPILYIFLSHTVSECNNGLLVYSKKSTNKKLHNIRRSSIFLALRGMRVFFFNSTVQGIKRISIVCVTRYPIYRKKNRLGGGAMFKVIDREKERIGSCYAFCVFNKVEIANFVQFIFFLH